MSARGLTAGQMEVLTECLLADAAAAEENAKAAGDGKFGAFYRGQAIAYRAAEQALRVAAVGGLARPSSR